MKGPLTVIYCYGNHLCYKKKVREVDIKMETTLIGNFSILS